MRKPIHGVMVLTVAALLASGCSSGEETAQDNRSGSSTSQVAETFDFGAPADAAVADRVIEVTANDNFTLEPNDIAATVGETVTFRVTNSGKLSHEFVLGDEDVQMKHEKEMKGSEGMDDMAGDPNGIAIPSGKTVDLTWRFSKAGAIIAGCHTQGHYANGMRAKIRIEAA